MPELEKTCSTCGREKPMTDDHFLPVKGKPGRFHASCRDCYNASARRRWAARRRATGVPCACGCGRFPPSLRATHLVGHFKPQGALGRVASPMASRHPTSLELAWAAGIYEGEGSAGYSGISVGQRDRWILDRFQELFGGSVGYDRKVEMHYWRASGARARGFLMTVFRFLSPRRRTQALTAIETLGTHPGHIHKRKPPRSRVFPHRRRRASGVPPTTI